MKKKMRKKEKSWTTTTTTRKDEDEGHEWNEMKSKTKWMNIEGMNRTEENRTSQYVCLCVWICKLKEPLKWMDKCTNVCLSWTPVHGSNDVVWAKQIIYSFFHSVVVFHVFHSFYLEIFIFCLWEVMLCYVMLVCCVISIEPLQMNEMRKNRFSRLKYTIFLLVKDAVEVQFSLV